MTEAIPNGRNPHDIHGDSDIRDLPKKYKEWVIIGNMTTWRTLEDGKRFASLPLEERTPSNEKGFDVHVDVLFSPEGKLRAYCEYCHSENCIHAWMGIQQQIKLLIQNYLEKETGDFLYSLEAMRKLSVEDKEKILQAHSIDIEDLKRYLKRIEKESKGDIEKWFKDVEGNYQFFP